MIHPRTVTVTVSVETSTIATEGETLDTVIGLIKQALASKPLERDIGGSLVFGTWRSGIVSGKVETR